MAGPSRNKDGSVVRSLVRILFTGIAVFGFVFSASSIESQSSPGVAAAVLPLAPDFDPAPPTEQLFSPIPSSIAESAPLAPSAVYSACLGTNYTCNANDVKIGTVLTYTVFDDGCLSENDTISLSMMLAVTAGSSSRYDIGFWIATSGTVANSGQAGACFRDYLHPIGLNTNLTSGVGPYLDLENAGINGGTPGVGPDTCGDVGSNSVQYYRTPILELSCRDINNNGFLDVSTIVGWDNNPTQANKPEDACTAANWPTQINPNTTSKCTIDNALQIPLRVPPGNIELTKSALKSPVNAGENITYEIVVASPPPGFPYDIWITDTLPAGFADSAWKYEVASTYQIASSNSPSCTIGLVPGKLTCGGWLQLPAPNLITVTLTAPTSVANCGSVVNGVQASFRPAAITSTINYRDPVSATVGVLCSKVGINKVTLDSNGNVINYGVGFPMTITQNGNIVISTTVITPPDPLAPYYTANLTPGLRITVTEGLYYPADWTNTSGTCSNGTAAGWSSEVLSVTLVGGSNTLCVFINTYNSPTAVTLQTFEASSGGAPPQALALAGAAMLAGLCAGALVLRRGRIGPAD